MTLLTKKQLLEIIEMHFKTHDINQVLSVEDMETARDQLNHVLNDCIVARKQQERLNNLAEKMG